MTTNAWNWEGWNFNFSSTIFKKIEADNDEIEAEAEAEKVLANYKDALQHLYVATGLTQEDLKADLMKEHIDDLNGIQTNDYRFNKIANEARRICGFAEDFYYILTISPEVGEREVEAYLSMHPQHKRNEDMSDGDDTLSNPVTPYKLDPFQSEEALEAWKQNTPCPDLKLSVLGNGDRGVFTTVHLLSEPAEGKTKSTDLGSNAQIHDIKDDA